MPTLALCMIVRDAESTLPACLETVKDLVDEIVIADTGSSDRTLEVAGGPQRALRPERP
jgi:glycosyltransferase involved in cell wall biosynthesis